VRGRIHEAASRRGAVRWLVVAAVLGAVLGVVVLSAPPVRERSTVVASGTTAEVSRPLRSGVVDEGHHSVLRRAGHAVRLPALRALLVAFVACIAAASIPPRRWRDAVRVDGAWSSSCVPRHRRGPPHPVVP